MASEGFNQWSPMHLTLGGRDSYGKFGLLGSTDS